ncbi:uncharacterized protein RHO17_020029 isoform 1-T1 [Thomomys bottae]
MDGSGDPGTAVRPGIRLGKKSECLGKAEIKGQESPHWVPQRLVRILEENQTPKEDDAKQNPGNNPVNNSSAATTLDEETEGKKQQGKDDVGSDEDLSITNACD